MALTYTPEPQINDLCPDFLLPSVDHKKYSLKDFENGKALIVMFICNHCPYVKAVEERLLNLANQLQPQGAKFLAICSNDWHDYPEDSPEKLLKRFQEKNYPFPYLIDEDQLVAKKFGAVCTPDIFVYDGQMKLKYRGRIDDSWKEPEKVTKQELKNAIEAILKSQKPSEPQNPGMGCSIKWKK